MEYKKTIGWQIFSNFKKWRIMGSMLFFDVLFFVSLFSGAKIFDIIFLQYETTIVGSIWGYLLFIVYFGWIVFAYSFFKYCTFDSLEQLASAQKKFEFNALWKFYVYNLIALSVLGIVLLAVIMFFSVSLVTVIKKPSMIIFYSVFLAGGYMFIQTSHAVFAKKKETLLKELPKETWKLLSLIRVRNWVGWNTCFLALLIIIYATFFFAVASLMQKASIDQSFMQIFYIVNAVIFAILVIISYLLIVWNRIYLFFVISNALEYSNLTKNIKR